MKINTRKIEGYDDMTLEQKLSALEAYEVDEPDYTGYVPKEVFDRTASELANSKKQLREKMSAEEIKAKEDADKWDALIKERDALLREKTISGHKAQYLALGYDEKLATETAEAMANGEIEKVFANQRKHNEALEKKIRADVLKGTPIPEGGTGSETITKEIFSKMSIAEQHKYSVEHPEEYKMLYGGK